MLQVMQSLDHLVSDIEHARHFDEEEQYQQEALSGLQDASSDLQDMRIGARHLASSQHAVECVLADMAAQLSSKYDLHDSWSER